jgi:hypothetical protein
MTLPNLAALLRELSEAQVDHIVIGGVAVGLHGFLRATEDLDIVPDPASDNLDRLADFLERSGASMTLQPSRRFGSRERWELQRGRNVSVATPNGDLDIVRTLDGVPDFATLRSERVAFDVGDIVVDVASPAALIAMKTARASALDLADVDALRELTS